MYVCTQLENMSKLIFSSPQKSTSKKLYSVSYTYIYIYVYICIYISISIYTFSCYLTMNLPPPLFLSINRSTLVSAMPGSSRAVGAYILLNTRLINSQTRTTPSPSPSLRCPPRYAHIWPVTRELCAQRASYSRVMRITGQLLASYARSGPVTRELCAQRASYSRVMRITGQLLASYAHNWPVTHELCA